MFEDDTNYKVLAERMRQIEIRCDKKDAQIEKQNEKIEKLNSFKDTIVGFTIAISTTCAAIVQFVFNIINGKH